MIESNFPESFSIIIGSCKPIIINFYLPTFLTKRKTPVRNARSAADRARDVGYAVGSEYGVPCGKRLVNSVFISL
jgi:hypothetical protein